MTGCTDSVGIVGLGLIGMALAKRLLGAGFEVHGYDINPDRGALLAASNGTAAGSLLDIGKSCSHDPDRSPQYGAGGVGARKRRAGRTDAP